MDFFIESQVKTYANLAAFPASGSLKTIYIAEDTNKTYRWTGSVYVEISASAAMTWGQIGGTLSNQTDLQTALNAKQDSLGFTPVPTTRTLTINGVAQDLSADRSWTIATGLTVGTTPISSGTIGRVLFQGTGNVLQQSSSLFWDSTNNRLGIGTSSPSQALDISGNINALNNSNTALDILTLRNTSTGNTNQTRIRFYNDSGASPGNGGIIFLTGNNYSLFPTNSFGFWNESANGVIALATNNTERLRLFSTGNLGINTTTDAGFRLDVNGTARVQTSLEIAGATGLTLGGGVSTLAYAGSVLNIGNSASWTDVRLFAGGVQKFSQTSSLTTISNTTINLSTATVQLAGVNALTYSGTDIRIGSVAAGFNSLSMYVAGSERARIASTGNVLINTTTDAGFRLDVNGTARVNTLTVGLGAGQIVTNTVLGFQGLFSNTTGLQNVAIGYQSLYTNTTGGQNIAIGVSSLVFNTTGTGNTSLGDESMLRNTTGARNTAIGQRAGTYAGSGTANNQTSSNSIYLGYQTRASASGATNEVVIGYDTLGLGNNTVVLGNTSITKTFLRGTINAANLPTSSAGLSAGDIWNDGGTLKIV